MKKYYTTSEFKNWHKRKIQNQRNRRKKYNEYSKSDIGNTFSKLISDPTHPVFAPIDFRLIENTEACLSFFRDVRNEDNLYIKNHRRTIFVSLSSVNKVDYGTISIFMAISDDLKSKRIVLEGDLPNDEFCKLFMNKKFPKAQKSQFIFFEKGSGILSNSDNMKITELVKQVVNHLTNKDEYSLPVKTIILEICGNSIEWGGTESKQWLLGVKYEQESVIFTVSDVGKGILDTLYRKFKTKFAEFLKPDHEILLGAFDQKYGSNTKEVNRNKGLPAVKHNFVEGTIRNLKVLTNNAILHFDNMAMSKTFAKGKPRFKGTFYQWDMTKDCINKI
jgi:hypothetical protein